MVIATIANGLNTRYSSGDIYIVTGVILLLAVIARHRVEAASDGRRREGRERFGDRREAPGRCGRRDQEIGVGMLGYAFMGKGTLDAFRKIAYMTWPPPLMPRLVAIAGRDEAAVADAAHRYGYERWTTDWRDIVSDRRSGCSTTVAPTHSTPSRRSPAAQAGKHVLCEKPLGRDADESTALAGRRRRRREASLRLQLPLRAGRTPRARDHRGGRARRRSPLPGALPAEWGGMPTSTPGASTRQAAGSGALGDLGAHIIDLARYLVGDIAPFPRSSAPSSPAARSTTSSWRPSSSRAAPSGRSRHAARARPASTTTPSR